MSQEPRWRRYLRFFSRNIDADIEDELQFHLEMRKRHYEALGLPSNEARAAAHERFGDYRRVAIMLHAHDAQHARHAERREIMSNLLRDLRHTIRGLRRSPSLTLMVTIILGLGIGMAAAVFTVYQAVLLHRLPIRDQARTVVLWGELPGRFPNVGLPYPSYVRMRNASRALSNPAAFVHYRIADLLLRDGDRTIQIRPSFATGNFFEALGTRPVIGRLLRPSDDVVGAVPGLVLAYSTWQSQFGGDSAIAGRRLAVAGSTVSVPIIGVAPPGLDIPLGADGWFALLAAAPNAPTDSIGRSVPLNIVGELAPGATVAQARDELALSLHELHGAPPEIVRQLVATVRPIGDVMVGDLRPALVAVTLAVILLMLIACANVGNLLIVRAAGRQHEIAVRRALGASFADVMRVPIAESVVLGVLGCVLGSGLAEFFVHIFLVLAPADFPKLETVSPGAETIIIATGVALVSTVLCGLSPAVWSARAGIGSPLRTGVRTGTLGSRARLTRSALVSWQVALAIVVLTGAGLVVRSLERLQHLDLGLRADGLAIAELDWPWSSYGTLPRAHELMDRVVARLEAVPGVVAASPVYQLPFSGAEGANHDIIAEGQPENDPASTVFAGVELAGPDYFRAFGIPLLRGRQFTTSDREGTTPVVIISEEAARRLWPGVDPIGKRLRINAATERAHWLTVVGVVPETRYHGFASASPSVYYPYAQYPTNSTLVAVRTSNSSRTLIAALREAVAELDPRLRIWRYDSMDDLLAGPLARPRLNTFLFTSFALTALLLAAIGLYAVTATAVRQQTRELGIRIALGAAPTEIARLVISRALVMVAVGLVIGLLAALGTSRVLHSLLYQVSPTDPLTLGGVCIVLVTAALIAAYVPARRAMRLDPVQALRIE
jgi:putative ABC transport system permease protein